MRLCIAIETELVFDVVAVSSDSSVFEGARLRLEMRSQK